MKITPNYQKPAFDPKAYAQTYATQNGITLEAAKNELKAKHGDHHKHLFNFGGTPESSSIGDNFSSSLVPQQGKANKGGCAACTNCGACK